MADKVVSWKILADFAKARKEADKTADSFQELDDWNGKVSKSSAAADKQAVSADKQHTASLQAKLVAMRRARAEQEQGVSAAQKSFATLRAQRKALQDTATATEKLSAAEHSRVSVDKEVTAGAQAKFAAMRRARVEQEQGITAAQRSLAALRAQRQEQRASVVAETQHVVSTRSLTTAITENVVAVGRRAQAFRAARSAQKALNQEERLANATSAGLTAAEGRLAAVNLSRQRAALALESAQRRLTAADAKHGQSSSQYANSLLSVQRATLEVDRIERTHIDTMKRVTREREAAAGGSGRLGGAVRSMGAAFFSSGGGIQSMGKALRLLKFPAIAAAIGVLVTAVSNLAAGAVSLIGPLSSLVGVVAAMPQAFTVAAGAVGTFMAAFAGIGGALKEGTAVQQGATKAAQQHAKAARDNGRAQKNAARAIKQAQRGVVDAQRGVKDALRGVADAQRGVADAERGVADARRNSAESARQSASSIKAAQRGVIDAKRAENDAEKNLHDARVQAKKDIEDMQKALRDLEMQERGAAISVEEARRNLDATLIDPGADSLAKDSAQLAYDEAIARLDDVKKERSQAAKDAKEAKKKGVEGSDIVIAAHRAEKDAIQGVTDAQNNLSESRRQAGIAAAASARAIKDAQRGVADAERNVADAHRGVADAERGVADARQAVKDAQDSAKQGQEDYTRTLNEGTTAVDKFAQSMKKLSPEGRAFVTLLLGMRDELQRLQWAAQRGLLPGLGRALTTMLKLMPLAEDGLFRFGKVMGDTAEKGANMLTSGPFTKMFGRLLDSNEKILRNAGDAVINIAGALVYVMDAARPFTEWLSQTILGWTQFWFATAKAGDKVDKFGRPIGSIAKKLQKTKEVLEILGGAVKNLWGTFKNLGGAGMDLGMDLLRSFRRITGGWKKWTQSTKGKNELKDWFDSARPALHEASKLLGAVTRAIFDMGRNNDIAPLIKKIRTDLLPAIVNLLDALQGDFATSMVDALTSIANVIAKLTGDSSSGLTVFVRTIGFMADVFSRILDNKAAATVISGMIAAFAALAAIRFVGAITGISTLMRKVMGLTKGGGLMSRIFGGNKAGKHAKEQENAFKTVGTAMGRGLRKGWEISSKEVVPSLNTQIGKLIAAAKTKLGIKSPSRVFILIGEEIAAGLARGMRLSSPEVAAASASMTGAAVSAGNKAAATAGVGGAVGGRGGSRKATKGAGKKKGFVGRVASVLPGRRKAAGGGVSAGADVEKSGGKIAGGATKAAGAVGALTLALSFLPGPIGEAASQLSMIGLVLGGFAPLLAPIGKALWGLTKGVGRFVGFMVKGFGKLLGFVGKTLFKLVGIVGKAMLLIGRAMLANPWMLLIAALVIVVILVVKNWDKIKKIVMKAINFIVKWVKDHWDIIKYFMGPLVLLIDLVVRNWDKIKKAITKAITGIITWVAKNWTKLHDIFRATFKWLGDKSRDFWNNLRTGFTNGVNAVVKVFDKLKTGVGNAWRALQNVVKKPVRFIIDTVLNKGLIAGYNKIAGFLNIGGIDEINMPRGFAKGGVYPGYTPGRDIGYVGVSGGEAIMRPEWTRAVGKDQIDEWNAAARKGGVSALRKRMQDKDQYHGGFAKGGVVWPTVGRRTSTYRGHDGVDINQPPGPDFGAPIYAYRSGRITYTGWGHGYGDAIFEQPNVGPRVVYGHGSRVLVHAGQRVQAGQQIGNVGATGHASGPHLHFGVPNGTYAQALGLLHGSTSTGAGRGSKASGDGLDSGLDGGELVSAAPEEPGWLKKILSNVKGWVAGKVTKGIDALTSKFGDSRFIDMLSAVPKNFIAKLTGKIEEDHTTWYSSFGTVLKGAGDLFMGAITQATGSTHAQVRSVAKNYGWDKGAQWNALSQLIQSESSWNPKAANPGSSARGLFQKMTSIHGPVEKTAAGQARWGLNYIKGRYGTPIRAWAFHKQKGTYDEGGVVPTDGTGLAGTGDAPQAFAKGGSVPGVGNRDTVPAMLTPGEFVMTKNAVRRVGVGALEKVNRFAKGGAVVAPPKRKRWREGRAGDASYDAMRGVQHFHRGGVVLGARQGARGGWVKALERLAHVKVDGTWDKALNTILRNRSTKDLFGAKPLSVDMPETKDLALLDYVRGAKITAAKAHTAHHKVKKGESVKDILNRFYGSTSNAVMQKFLKTNGLVQHAKHIAGKPGTAGHPGTPGTAGGTGAALARAIGFARRQSGKPYIWGGAGPRGYDCSGYQSAITNVIKGRSPYHRLFATSSMSGALPRLGFKPGLGDKNDYKVGWRTGSPGHTAGTLGTLKVESTGNHVRNGAAARGAGNPMFSHRMHLPLSGGKATKGKPGTPGKPGTKGRSVLVGKKYGLNSDLPDGRNLKIPIGATKKGSRSWENLTKKFGVSNSTLYGWLTNLMPRFSHISGDKRSKIMSTYNRMAAPPTSPDYQALNTRLGLKNEKNKFTPKSQRALAHVLDHTFGRTHNDLADRPWQYWSPLESAIITQRNANAKNAKWQTSLEKISSWGYEELLSNLFSTGIDDGYNTAIGAAANQRLAKTLNDELKIKGSLSDEDFQNLIKMVGFMNANSQPQGLRDIARHLGLSDYDTVRLWEAGLKANKFGSVPASKRSTLTSDVSAYRNGTFYAAKGGEVPGSGSGDKVPAMLTPGEFVVRKKAAEALGLGNLMALNNDPTQFFAKGGLVMAPQVRSIPTVAAAGVSSRRMAAASGGGVTYNYTYDVDINNPIAEKSTYSMTKMLQRQSVLKTGARHDG